MHLTRLNEISSSDKIGNYQNSFTIPMSCPEKSHTNSKRKSQISQYHNHHAKYTSAVAQRYTTAQRLGLITWAIEPAVASSSISESEVCGLDKETLIATAPVLLHVASRGLAVLGNGVTSAFWIHPYFNYQLSVSRNEKRLLHVAPRRVASSG
jgi:hypothetical protein